LDGQIYCAMNGRADANDLGTSRLIEARANGFVVIGQPARRRTAPPARWQRLNSAAALPSEDAVPMHASGFAAT